MKTLKLVIAGIVLLATTVTEAQISADIHIGPPVWAPSAPAAVEYYYLPDIGVYYDVPQQRYIYPNRGTWVRTTVLPARYRGYDLYRSHPVYLADYRGNAPYTHYKVHKVKYKGNGWKHGHGRGKHKRH